MYFARKLKTSKKKYRRDVTVVLARVVCLSILWCHTLSDRPAYKKHRLARTPSIISLYLYSGAFLQWSTLCIIALCHTHTLTYTTHMHAQDRVYTCASIEWYIYINKNILTLYNNCFQATSCESRILMHNGTCHCELNDENI